LTIGLIPTIDWINVATGVTVGAMNQSLLKTLSFAALHFGVAFSVTYALTGSVTVATGVGLIEPIVNTVVFFFHERAWLRVARRAHARPGAAPASCGIVGAG
jgi:uncharacterized membrane protein